MFSGNIICLLTFQQKVLQDHDTAPLIKHSQRYSKSTRRSSAALNGIKRTNIIFDFNNKKMERKKGKAKDEIDRDGGDEDDEGHSCTFTDQQKQRSRCNTTKENEAVQNHHKVYDHVAIFVVRYYHKHHAILHFAILFLIDTFKCLKRQKCAFT